MPKTILDTNFLMIPGQFKVDIFDDMLGLAEGEVCVLDLSVKELEKLSETGNTNDRTAAKIALELLKRKHLKVVPGSSENSVDDAIIEALEPGDTLCTQDKELKQRAKDKGIKVVTLKNKSHLGLV